MTENSDIFEINRQKYEKVGLKLNVKRIGIKLENFVIEKDKIKNLRKDDSEIFAKKLILEKNISDKTIQTPNFYPNNISALPPE